MGKAFFVSFEGLDGVGKGTQLRKLHVSLIQKNLSVCATSEPYARQMMVSSFGVSDESTRTLLFLADRALHVQTMIKPMLNAGNIVLCDRFVDSTKAYQGYGGGVSIDFICEGNFMATQGWLYKPDVTFLLDAPIDVLEARVIARGKTEGYDTAGLGFRQRVREGYLKLAELHWERIHVIDADRQVEVIAAEILAIVLKKLGVE